MGDKIFMKIDGIAALRGLLLDAEKSFGLESLNQHERDIYYATVLLSKQHVELSAGNIYSHELVRDLPRTTFYRVLKGLAQRNLLVAPERKNGAYKVVPH